jgi:hypothetical protein
MPTLSLSAPRIVFPVKIPYIVRSDMYKLGKPLNGMTEDHMFMIDAAYETNITTVLDMLQAHPEDVRLYLDDDLDGLLAGLWAIAQTIADDQPNYFTYQNGLFTTSLLGISLAQNGELAFRADDAAFPELGASCYAHLQTVSGIQRVCDMLRLSVQEDLVIGKIDPDTNTDVMECMLVPLPSKWSPQEKIGLSFAGTHAVIPNSERLVSAAPRLVDAIMSKGPYVRYNWTLASDRLPQDPRITPDFKQMYAALEEMTDIDEIMATYHFRVERQTLKALPNLHRYVFAIHTYSNPLAEVLTSTDRQQQLLDVLETMPGDVRSHRSMTGSVITALRQQLGSEPSQA